MPLRLPATITAASLPGATTRPARASLPHHPLSPLHVPITTTTTALSFSTSHPPSKDATVLVDQTRRDNRPGGAFKQGEGEAKAKEKEKEGEGSDPAGEGPPAGGAAQRDVDAVEGARQHSVKRPVPTEGSTAAGRGGDKL